MVKLHCLNRAVSLLGCSSQVPEKPAVMSEGDLRNGATSCLLTCPAATLRSAAGIHHVRGDSLVHLVRDGHRPYRDRWGQFQSWRPEFVLACFVKHKSKNSSALRRKDNAQTLLSSPLCFLCFAGEHIRQPCRLSL